MVRVGREKYVADTLTCTPPRKIRSVSWMQAYIAYSFSRALSNVAPSSKPCYIGHERSSGEYRKGGTNLCHSLIPKG